MVETGAAMREFVHGMVVELVDHPEQVRVGMISQDRSLVLNVLVAPTDLGKVIGKQGRTARSLRTIVLGASRKHGHHCELNFDMAEGGGERA